MLQPSQPHAETDKQATLQPHLLLQTAWPTQLKTERTRHDACLNQVPSVPSHAQISLHAPSDALNFVLQARDSLCGAPRGGPRVLPWTCGQTMHAPSSRVAPVQRG